MQPRHAFRSSRFEGEAGTDRVRTTHTGSLPRPPALLAKIAERERGGPELEPEAVRAAVAECVRRQVDAGLDVVNDGETATAPPTSPRSPRR